LHDRRHFTGKFSRQIAKRSDARAAVGIDFVGLRPTLCAVAPKANSAHCRCKRRYQLRTIPYAQDLPERDRGTRKKQKNFSGEEV
jgi:hypothetical protein